MRRKICLLRSNGSLHIRIIHFIFQRTRTMDFFFTRGFFIKFQLYNEPWFLTVAMIILESAAIWIFKILPTWYQFFSGYFANFLVFSFCTGSLWKVAGTYNRGCDPLTENKQKISMNSSCFYSIEAAMSPYSLLSAVENEKR